MLSDAIVKLLTSMHIKKTGIISLMSNAPRASKQGPERRLNPRQGEQGREFHKLFNQRF
jgi:hypothetical protein